MKKIRLGFVAAFAVASTLALAADPGSDAARQDRMDSAYQNFKSKMDRGGSAVGRGTRDAGHAVGNAGRRAGHAIGNAARETGHAVGTGIRKTGHAIERGGEKLQDKSEPKP